MISMCETNTLSSVYSSDMNYSYIKHLPPSNGSQKILLYQTHCLGTWTWYYSTRKCLCASNKRINGIENMLLSNMSEYRACCLGCIAWPNTCLRKIIVMVFVFQICGQIIWACLCLMCSSCISFCTFHHMKVFFIIWKYSSSHENSLHYLKAYLFHMKVSFTIWKYPSSCKKII